MSINNNKLMELISGVLDIDLESVDDYTSPENTESWDSFTALVMVSDLESTFDVNFSIEEVYLFRCVKDIRDVLISHNVDFNEQ